MKFNMKRGVWSFNYSLYNLHRKSINHNKANFSKVKMKKDRKDLKPSYWILTKEWHWQMDFYSENTISTKSQQFS